MQEWDILWFLVPGTVGVRCFWLLGPSRLLCCLHEIGRERAVEALFDGLD